MRVNNKLRLAVMFLAVCFFNINLLAFPAKTADWGRWNTTQYDGIDYRFKCSGYNESAKKYDWQVQFRNRYREKVHFSFKLADTNERVTRTSARLSLRSGSESSGSEYALLNAPCVNGTIGVYVNEVRIKEQDSGPYVNPN